MYLFYTDESHTDPHERFFSLASVGVAEGRWRDLDECVTRLKSKWFPWAKPEDVEFKGHDILEGKEVFRALKDRRFDLFLELSDIVEDAVATVIAVVVDKDSLPETFERRLEPIYRVAYWQLLDVVNELLAKQSQRGWMMMDARSTLHTSVQDRRLVEVYREYLQRKGESHLVEMPLFGFSHFYSVMQLADFCAYCVSLSFKREIATPPSLSPQRQEAEHVAMGKVRAKLARLVAIP